MGDRGLKAITLKDGYKVGHPFQYPPKTEMVYSNLTARGSRIEGIDSTVFFGLRYAIIQYLEKMYKETFFDKPKEEAVGYYKRRMNKYLGEGAVDMEHIERLHDLGYLPIEIRAVEEGVAVPIGVPMVTFKSTIDDFYWVTNSLESLLSCLLWPMVTVATIAKRNLELIRLYGEKTGADEFAQMVQAWDFSFRGMFGPEAGMMASASHLTCSLGTDGLPGLDLLEDFYSGLDVETLAVGVPACYDDTTEILTEDGFVAFKDLSKTAKVAQYHNDGGIDFVKPDEYFEDDYDGPMVKFGWNAGKTSYVDLVVTPNHRMWERGVDGDMVMFEAQERNFCGKSKKIAKIVKAGVSASITGDSELPTVDQLAIAFQADGSFPSRSHRYTGARTGKFPIRFSLKRRDKISRLKDLLNELEYEYTSSDYSDGYTSFWIKCPNQMSKSFDWVSLNQSIEYNKKFINELQFWDGSKSSLNTISYYSSDKSCADKVQAIACLSGFSTTFSEYYDKRNDRKTQYTVMINTMKSSIGANSSREFVDYSGKVYCVKVPSGMLVVRRNNSVVVCGNTEHAVMCAGSKENERETIRRLIEDTYPTGIVSIVSDTWDFWNVIDNILPSLKDVIMARDGKAVWRPDTGIPEDIICGDSKLSGSAKKGLVEALWDEFGGTVNEKGYKVLDSHVGAIYGDSITHERMKDIFERLEKKGFSSDNIVFGIGSYTYQYVTRDTVNMAIKATASRLDGVNTELFKDPITDRRKKSHKGFIKVEKVDGVLTAKYPVSEEEANTGELKLVWRGDTGFIRNDTIESVRKHTGLYK